MGVLKLVLSLVVFLLLTSAVCALESYQINYNVVGSNVVVENVVRFSKGMTGTLSLSIPPDAETIEVYLDDVKTDAEIKNNSVKIYMDATKEIKLSYITKEHIDRSNFLLNKIIEYDADSFEITLVLPEEAVLKRQIKDETGSIFPRPDKATTDGRSLIFIWEREDVEAGDEVSIFVMYKTKEFSLPLPMSILVAILILALVVYFYYTKKPTKKEVKKKVKKKATEHKMLKHLKEDEQQIVRVLKQRKGSCEQGTLRVVTNFSKARLSRLLMELEERRIIYKEKRGKKNLIFLK
ncbi:hypothetical protein KY331_02115 [Candidatus Woesearchaeota archaeon]|nr:hypothetical protein [Candidatus Woesearchaeota archaeon]